jgi:type II secretory ATPase GspE/PulE/Tfp pilus assembly ATPase PilB-like protein/CheY-like chemotaxis protein
VPEPIHPPAHAMLRQAVASAFPACKGVMDVADAQDISSLWTQLSEVVGLTPFKLADSIATVLGLKHAVDLSQIDLGAVLRIPQDLATAGCLLPIGFEGDTLVLASALPFDGVGGIDRVRFFAGCPIRTLVASPDQLFPAIASTYSRSAEEQSAKVMNQLALSNLSPEETPGTNEESPPTPSTNPSRGVMDIAVESDSAVVRLAQTLIRRAIEARASDLHIQPHGDGGVCRIRVDGVLHRIAYLPGTVLAPVIRYFKTHSGMDSSTRLIAQDGRQSLTFGQRQFDLRLSVLPANGGERLVIRFLDQGRQFHLGRVGFSMASLQGIRRLLGSSSGVVLLTGPTGSGKTSTLYAMLTEINHPGINIITVENPVEYRVPGISQVEINPKAGLTFASALRSILRQDPDVVLVGEIRDEETAQIAMQAALTGHLVLSTLHTNDALGAIPRLMDLGISPAIIADALHGVAAQRLVRKVCERCRQPVTDELTPEEKAFQQVTGELPVYRAVGCDACAQQGFSGRFPVLEVLEITPKIAEDIRNIRSDQANLAEKTQGSFATLSNVVAHRVISGDTTAGEASRVLGQRFWQETAAAFKRPSLSQPFIQGSFTENNSDAPNLLFFSLSEPFARSCEKAFIAQDFRPLIVTSLAQLRGFIESNAYLDIVVLDVDPGVDDHSLAFMQHLRRLTAWARLPVQLVLRQGDEELARVFRDHGVHDLVFKPVTPERIAERARSRSLH